MEKAQFIENAPVFYALAICNALRGGAPVSSTKIRGRYTRYRNGLPVTLLGREDIWRKAVRWLSETESVGTLAASFGAPLYEQGTGFDELWKELGQRRGHPFYMYLVMDDDDWLKHALADVDAEYERLGVNPDDFENPDREWAPIQLEEADPQVQAVTNELDAVIEEVRKDNGYAATLPEERAYVLEGLGSVAAKFKTRVISIAYLRQALDRLNILSRRFAGAALAVTVTGAKQAIIEFIKTQGTELLQALRQLL